MVLVALGIAAVWAFSDKEGPVPPSPAATTTGTTVGTGTPPTPSPAPHPNARGTLSGTMTIGPICPVEQIGNPCKPTPEMYAARKVAVYALDKKTLIATLIPDASGQFSVSLPVGTYYVAMASPQSGVGSTRGVPATISIKAGATARIAIDIDTGIR